MTLAPVVRRLVVTIGLGIAVLAAAGTILAAASWTATEAPLAAAPVTIASVQAALDNERQRSAALEEQLRSLEGASGDLTAALTAAQDQLAADAVTASDLRTALAEAQAKLTKLEAALKAAAKARTTTTVTTSSTSVTSGGEREEEHEDEADDD